MYNYTAIKYLVSEYLFLDSEARDLVATRYLIKT